MQDMTSSISFLHLGLCASTCDFLKNPKLKKLYLVFININKNIKVNIK